MIAGGLLCGCLASPPSADAGGEARGLTVVDRVLTFSTDAGRSLSGPELVDATLRVGEARVRLRAYRAQPLPTGGSVGMYELARVRGQDEEDYCSPAADGSRSAVPLLTEDGRVFFACSSGAIGKCALFGYWPNEPATREAHAACVRMVRADYGGDGVSATADGTPIDFCDTVGVRPCPADIAAIEAAWTPDGAACVARTRVAEVMTLDALARQHPSLASRLGKRECTAAVVRREPRAVLLELSTPRQVVDR